MPYEVLDPKDGEPVGCRLVAEEEDAENPALVFEEIPEGAVWDGAAGEPGFLNGWVNFGGTFESTGFHKDPLGRVHLRGAVKNGTAGTVAFTLPAGYRPPAAVAFVGARTGGDANCRILVAATGDVSIATPNNAENHLNGVSFRV